MNKSLAWAVGILVVIALILGVYLMGVQNAAAPTSEETASGDERMMAPTWHLEEEGEDETGAPLTHVAVTYAGEEHDLGIQQGSCTEIAGSSWVLLPGEVSGVICWWAGGGVEFGVFEEGDGLVVKKGMLDEGNAEEAGVRGSFISLLSL